ncbi:ATP-binding cassette sub-family D member 4-like [Oopsacas minuta]|uniref:ATP-binding cassette sub-family D member 4-like n=1 Tax=Oopsacas minuta TaxID=111878 RepID=A0AAV7K8K8_9METZ|nr:ATP-binding cassette sub-family D member 4-like [Oopsacas minuta]
MSNNTSSRSASCTDANGSDNTVLSTFFSLPSRTVTIPGVSKNAICTFPCVITPVDFLCVVCMTCEVGNISRGIKLFIKEDFPAFGSPRIATFRKYYHVLLREHADSVSLQRGFEVEAEKIGRTFRGTLNSQRVLLHWRYPLQMAINITDYMGSLITYGIIAIPVFSGWYKEQSNAELAELISKSVFFTIYLINQFTTIIEQANELSLVSGFSIRVGELLHELNKIDKEREQQDKVTPLSLELINEGITIPIVSSIQSDNLGEDMLLSLRDVCIYSPDDRILINKLTFDVSYNCNTLIMGPSGEFLQ